MSTIVFSSYIFFLFCRFLFYPEAAFFAISLLNKATTGTHWISELFMKHAQDGCEMDEKTL